MYVVLDTGPGDNMYFYDIGTRDWQRAPIFETYASAREANEKGDGLVFKLVGPVCAETANLLAEMEDKDAETTK